jgi:raffinose/stachyose/melibiose transport system substrate-binding protein
MTKRTALGGALAALCLTTSLVGAASAGEVKVWMVTPSSENALAAWKQIIADFQAANPETTVTLETRSIDEHKAALRVAAQSDQGPDVYFMWAGLGLGGEFVNAGMSMPLDDAFANYGWDEKLVGTAAGFTKNYPPNRHGVPYSFRGEAIYYNKSLFEQAGITAPPASYDELKADAAKLKEAGIPAMTFGGTVNWHLMRLMDVILETKCGAEKHDALMAMAADWATEPCATESFVELHDWTANYILSPFMGIDQSQSANLFIAGKAAMMLEGDWFVGQMKEAGLTEAQLDIFPFPTGTDRLYGFGENLYVNSKSAVGDEAAKFLDYLISADVQQANLGQFGSVSVNAGVKYENVAPLDQKWLDIFGKYSNVYMNGDQAFPLDVTTEYWRIINEVASDALAPEEAGKAMQTFIAGRG